MTILRRLAITIVLALVASASAQTTPNLGLNIPTTGTQNWGPIINFNFSLLDTKLSCFGTAASAGTVVYYNGATWPCLGGNTVGTSMLVENASGVPSWQATSSVLSFTAPLVNTSGTVAISANGIGATQLAAQYSKLRCEPGLGDGLNAIAAGTYLQSTCYNDSGVTWTITGLRCFTDNAGTSTLNATNGAGTGLLTGTIACGTAFTAGTQSATTTIAAGDFVKFTFVADGTSKQTTWVVSFTQ